MPFKQFGGIKGSIYIQIKVGGNFSRFIGIICTICEHNFVYLIVVHSIFSFF